MTLFSIGHSNSKPEDVLRLLNDNGVKIVVDTRSKPYSRFNYGFNKERFDLKCDEAGIAYRWRGETLGGMMTPGMTTALALDKMAAAIKEGTVKTTALMCSEGQPCDCHRHHWLSQYLLKKHEIDVVHLSLRKPISKASEVKFNPLPEGLTPFLRQGRT